MQIRGVFFTLLVLCLMGPVFAQEKPAESKLKDQLKRLVVGNQGAILKIWKPGGDFVADYYRGLDDRNTAPYSAQDQTALTKSLGMTSGSLGSAALEVIERYGEMPKKNATAFMGLVHSLSPDSSLSPSTPVRTKIKEFLLTRLKEDKSVVIRRQACLSLAVGESVDPQVMDAVLTFYSGSENLWETFPVQQFFEYHAAEIRALPNFAEVKTRVEGVNSLYRANILKSLEPEEEKKVTKSVKPSAARAVETVAGQPSAEVSSDSE